MVAFAALMNAAYDALATNSSGASAPANGPGNAPLEFQSWFDTTSVNFPVLRFFDGVNWDRTGTLDVVNSNWLPQLGGGVATLVAAATVNIGASPQTLITISGATTITSFGSAAKVGEMKLVYAGGSFTLTNSGAIVCPNGQNITVRVGDSFFVGYLGSGNWQVLGYVRPSTKDIVLNIEDFGGKGDGSTDNSTPLASALAALGSKGGTIFFPAAGSRYLFNSGVSFSMPSGVFSVSIVGGGQDATELYWPNASGGITLNYNGLSSSAHVRDLTLTTGTTAGGDAIKFNLSSSLANPALTALSDITRVTCRGSDGYAQTNYWTNCINIANVSNVNIAGVGLYGSSGSLGNGVNTLGLPGSSTYAVQINVDESTLQNLNQGFVYGSFVQGVTIDDCNFTATNSGVISPAAQTGTLAQLAVTNSQFNPPASGFGIVTNTAITETQLTNNLFECLANNVTCISLVNNNHFNINGNEFGSSASFTGTTAVSIGTTTAGATGTIQGNDIFAFSTGITLAAGALGCAVMGNTINNAAGHGTTIIVNNSSSITNWIASNPGYNPVGPSAIGVGASPFTYTAGATPETVYVIGGTVTVVTFDKNGGTLGVVAASSASAILNGTFELGPWDQIKVTYGSAPSMNKMVH